MKMQMKDYLVSTCSSIGNNPKILTSTNLNYLTCHQPIVIKVFKKECKNIMNSIENYEIKNL
jgi:hypothetical protein